MTPSALVKAAPVRPVNPPTARIAGRYTRSYSAARAHALGSWAEACFNERAKGVANLTFIAKHDDPLTPQGELSDLPAMHWATQRLRKPNPEMSIRVMKYLISQLLDRTGDAFIWTPTYGEQVPQEMYLLPTSGLQTIPGRMGERPIRGYRYVGLGDEIVIPEREVCHVMHPYAWNDPWSMYYRGRALRQIIEDAVLVDQQTLRYLRVFFENNAQVSFGVSVKGELSPESFQDFAQKLTETYAGPDNAGKFMVLEHDATFVPFPSSGREKEMSEIDAGNRTRICAATGVPESILTAEHQNRASAETVESSFFRRTIADLGTLICDALSAHFSRYEYGIEIGFNAYVSNDPADRRADERHLVDLGMPVNDVFAERGIPQVPGGDIPRYSTLLAVDGTATGGAATGATATSAPPTAPSTSVSAPALPSGQAPPESAVPAIPALPTTTPALAAPATGNPATGQPVNGQRYHDLESDGERMAAIYWRKADNRNAEHAAILARDLRTIVAWMEAETIPSAKGHGINGSVYRRTAVFDLATAHAKANSIVGPDVQRIIDSEMREAAAEAGISWGDVEDSLGTERQGLYAAVMANVAGSIAKIHAEIGDLDLSMTDKPAEDVRTALTSKFALFAGPRAETIAEAAAKLVETRAKRMVWQAISPRASDGKSFRGRWVSRRDMRVRDDHKAADGQLMDSNWMFSIGGVAMYGPGDVVAGGDPKEVFRCRCTMKGEWA